MISYINIKNFAVIENSEIEFHKGLNVITGETGSGKSIVIEAVSLALGARADSAFVRTGADKAMVQLVAELDGEEYIITREVSAAGKNLCKLNGEIVTLSELLTYCRRIADIHGQYDHQSLLNPDYHIHLVDIYHKDLISPAKEKVKELYESYTSVKSRLNNLVKNAAENAKKRDFLRFQLDEIDGANLRAGEAAELKERIEILENSEKIYSGLSSAYEGIYDASPSALDMLKSISSGLSSVSSFSAGIEGISSRVESLCYELEDVAHEIRSLRDEAVFSQEELDEKIERYDEIMNLVKKYGEDPALSGSSRTAEESVLEFAETVRSSLLEVDNQDELEAQLRAELEDLRKALAAASEELSSLRRAAADELRGRIIEQLKDLNFANSELEISFERLENFTENGIDEVRFLISTNPGEPVRPLDKIASGGEMSRIMLAFKKIIADYDDIPTLIFDEIDTGISGIAASVVGKKMQEIARNHQIICITHLPQIAACGDYNYRIEKEADATSARTQVVALGEEDTVNEIARLLGGSNITPTTIASAKELIAASKVQ